MLEIQNIQKTYVNGSFSDLRLEDQVLQSDWVKKKDNTNRFCINFRRLNSVTKFDTEPMGNDEDIRSKLHGDKFFTKLDLSKGYWQIPVEKQSRHLTAFTTSEVSFQFRKMPFGTINSGATFNKMMRKLLTGCKHADNYVDDILGHTMTWDTHMSMLQDTGIFNPPPWRRDYRNGLRPAFRPSVLPSVLPSFRP